VKLLITERRETDRQRDRRPVKHDLLGGVNDANNEHVYSSQKADTE